MGFRVKAGAVIAGTVSTVPFFIMDFYYAITFANDLN
jgi:hypothetical protein